MQVVRISQPEKVQRGDGLPFLGLMTLISPSCGYFLRLLSAWIVAPRNLLFRKKSCANSQRETPRQVNLELVLLLTENKGLSVPHRCSGKRARLPRRESCSRRTHRGYPTPKISLARPRVVRAESLRPPYLPPTRQAHILHTPQPGNALLSRLGGCLNKTTHNLEKSIPSGMSLTIKVERVLATSNECIFRC